MVVGDNQVEFLIVRVLGFFIIFRVALRKQNKFQTNMDCRSISILCHRGSTVPDNVPLRHSRSGNCSNSKKKSKKLTKLKMEDDWKV